MPFFKRAREGYMLVDNRATGQAGAGRFLERAVITCHHCEKQVFRSQPSDEFAWCFKCDRYICDDCAVLLKLTDKCTPFKARVDEFANALVLQAQRLSP